jgi:16S rRNA (cytosine1402-N4)-methyltransferase
MLPLGVPGTAAPAAAAPPRPPRRVRYSGTHPVSFKDKYKELSGDAALLAQLELKGKTAAGTHRPVAVPEVLAALEPSLRAGACAVDCTLGYGGHARELLKRIAPGGTLYGLDADGATLSATEARLNAWLQTSGEADSARLVPQHCNYSAVSRVLLAAEPEGVDALLADLGCSSMQLDDPSRGFGFKRDGPLDMRLDPSRGAPASARLAEWSEAQLADLLMANADEPFAERLAPAIACAARLGNLQTTLQLAACIRDALRRVAPAPEAERSVRRTFQAIRIGVNDELRRLDALLLAVPLVLKPGARAAIISFHSGEDRRVKLAFKAGLADGTYSEISPEVIRPSMEEQRSNSRSACAKLRWAVRAAS